MIIECPSCKARYQYDERRFQGRSSKKIRCARCKEVFVVVSPAAVDGSPSRGSDAEEKATEQSAILTGPLQLPEGKRLSLAILDGPDAGRVYRIATPRVTIGREEADLVLEDPEASRLHAAIEVRDTATTLHDLGSISGTLTNSQRIEGAVELSDRSEFQVGATTLMLIVTEEPMMAPHTDTI
ncbi:MAG TPA: FHA domain-containing protein [Thermoanaerobaculia bacterium]